MQIREELEQLIDAAVAAACEDGTLTLEQAPEAALERPRDESNGDWASTVAMRSAKLAKKNPREIAQIIVDHLPENDMIASVEIAGPGFINIRLANAVLQGVVAEARAEKEDFGKGEIPEGERKINLEYISANPTGPLHVGHGRWAALGDATARVMRHAGYDVFEEFYINDAGTQMDNFGESVAVRYQQLLGRDVEMPEACYAGSYVKDIAQAIIDEDGDKWLDADQKERMENFRERAYAYELAEQHRVTERFGTTFECWFSERSLYVPDETGESAVDRSLKAMDEKGYIYVEDGATWFKSSAFDDEKDRVLIKANGEMTYFMSDVAYHYNKMERGFDHLINIWGADHHGYIARCEAMLAAWGWPGALEIIARPAGEPVPRRRSRAYVEAYGRDDHVRGAHRRGGRRRDPLPHAGEVLRPTRSTSTSRWRRRRTRRTRCTTCSTRTRASAPSCARPPTRSLPRPLRTARSRWTSWPRRSSRRTSTCRRSRTSRSLRSCARWTTSARSWRRPPATARRSA